MASKHTPKYEITVDPTLMDKELGMTEHIRKEISDSFFDVQKKKPHIVDRLNKQIAKYPHIPQFKNYLYTYYQSVDNKGKTQQALDLLVKEHPDYLYTRLGMIEDYLDRAEFGKIEDLIGKEPDLLFWYPERTIFHYNEVKHFEALVISYYLKIKKVSKAESHLDKLRKLGIYDDEIRNLQYRIMLTKIAQGFKRKEKEREKARNVIAVSSTTVGQTVTPPVFANALIYELYKVGMDIDHELIRQILSLPRESLIADLNHVIVDCIARYKYFTYETEYTKETHTFPLHALFLLFELKAVESLQVFFELLRQDREFTNYWFSDVIFEFFWQNLYVSSQDNLQLLADFMKEPDRYCFHRSEASVAISQIALHQPERREEVVSLYRELLNYFIQHQDDERLIDTDFIGMVVGDIVDLEGKELIPEITEIYNQGLANPGVSGSLKVVLKEISGRQRYDKKKKLSGINEIYAEIISWGNNNDGEIPYFDKGNDDFSKNDKYIPNVNVQPKVGRNDPCPCGSGKKYKKCCIDKSEN